MAEKKELAESKSHHEQMMDKKYSASETVKDQLNKIEDPMMKKSFRERAMIHMSALGWSRKEIATQLGLTPGRVNAILGSQSAKQQIFKMQEELYIKDPQKMFLQILPSAVRTAKTAMLSKKTSPSVRVDTAFRFMDRALGKPVQEIKHEGNAIRELFAALDRRDRGEKPIDKDAPVIDAEFKEVKSEINKDPLDSWLDENL